ncbi:hypothetical protein AB0I82_00010 [Streptomyces sp. NPDC050315]|uniref:hypothetical protein n=1 Tax=Streptomyces sp. NPDC050315 TaxID=3155039 RepID=UPI00344A35E6
MERIALTGEQVLAYGLPAAEGKKNDPRWPGFAREHGFDVDRPVQWEVEALDLNELQRLVLEAIDPYLDRQALAAVLDDERRQRRQLTDFIARWRPPN